MAKKVLAIYFTVFLLLSNYTFLIGISGAYAASSAPPSSQSITTTIFSNSVTSKPSAGVYWTQLDSGKFHAAWNNSWGKGEITVDNAGTSSNPYPAEGSVVPDDYDYGSQVPNTWLPYDGKTITKSLTSDVKIYDISFDVIAGAGTFSPYVDPVPIGNTVARFKTKTGGPIFNTRTPFPTNPNKYTVLYETPVMITWAGQLTETKTIDVTTNLPTVKAGQSQQLTAKIQTKPFNSSTPTTSTVSSNPETSWVSSDPSIVSVSNNGYALANKKGTTTITATWTKQVAVDQLISDPQTDGSIKLKINKGVSVTYQISDSVTITVGEEPGPEPTPTPTEPSEYVITGDFDILPSNTINWRDTYTLRPKNIVIPNGCTYQYHEYQMISDGVYWYSGKVTSRTADSTYSYANYPYNLVVGSNNISIKVVADCASSDWMADKVLNVNAPAGNNPPIFTPGFFKQYDRANYNPISEVVVGNRVDLRIINNPMTDPNEPYDPDGDPISYTWEFAGSTSSWIRNIGVENDPYTHEEYYNNILADELGNHCVYVTGRDPYGGSTRKQACINVVPPNPVPIIDAPSEVVEGRLLAFPISGARSYSPMGRTIDHSRDIWTNKQDKYMTPGIETITLEVFDSTGLKSLAPAAHNLTVKPDLPPVPKLEYVPFALRNNVVDFTNTSYSPDSDQIVVNTVTYRYDSDNDGNLAEESSHPIMTDEDEFQFTPTKVGKYSFTVFVKEDWGKTGTKDFILNVTNESPEADFSALSVSPEPPEISVISPPMNTLMTSSSWKASSITEPSTTKKYTLDSANNSLETARISNFMPYKSITTNNVTISKQEIYRSYCGQCGNPGSTSGYYYIFDPNLRIDRRMWANMNLNAAISSYYLEFYDEERPTAWSSYGNNPVTTVLGKGGYGNTYVNLSTGLIWQRINPQEYSRYSHTWEDHIYRLSDLKNFVPGTQTYWENRVSIQPMKTYTNTISTQVSSLPSQLTPPAMPSSYIMPTPIMNGVNMEVLRTDIEGKSLSSITVQSNFNKDGLGNEFKNMCILNNWPQSIRSCKLAKYSSTGQLLWESAVTLNYYESIVEFVSSDSSKLIIWDKASKTYWLLNNNDGSVISKFSVSPNSTFSSAYYYSDMGMLYTDGNYYLGVYNDVVAYITQTVEAGFMNIIGKKANWDLKFFNMVTGETTSVGIIKSYVGKMNGSTQDGYNVGNFLTAIPASVISADGKLIIANYYSNVLIYDMKTLFKEGDISTGLSDPIGYSSRGSTGGNYDRRYGVKGMSLTEDGRLKIVYREAQRSTSCGDNGDCDNSESFHETALTIQTTPTADNSFSYGYISGSEPITDGDLSLKVNFKKNIFSDHNGAGIGFRSQDNKNMYRVEVSTSQVKLVKVVDGESSALASFTYPIRMEQAYNLKVKARGTRIRVYMDGAPIIDVKDSTFTTGAFGIFAEVPYTVLKDFSVALYETTGDEVENLAIVNTPITYNKTYTDLENDPLISDKTTWKFTNIQPYKFLNVGDGTSDPVGTNSYNGVIVRQPSPSLSKVGVYSVELVETDDPAPNGYKHPSTAFEEFQKESDPANHHIVVHRRPIAQFSLSINSSTHLVEWSDTSYDPDRWLSPTNYSTESSGIDYRTTRGVLERRYYYIDPNGKQVNRQLVVPTLAGEYTVAETVRDEYGAWSDWEEQTITIETPVVNHPPMAQVTVPASTDQNNPTKFAAVRPTFRWTYSDEDGDPQSQYEMRIMRYGGSLLLSSGIRTGAATSWIPSADLPGGTNLYVQVRVYDGTEWSDWSSPKFFSINRPPAANFDWSPKPVYEGDTVQFSTTVSDLDNDTLAVAYEITSPDGLKQTFSYSFLSPYSTHAGPSIRMQATGTWTVKMTVSDGAAPAASVTKVVQVGALGVLGAVKHTDAWEKNRLAYNEKYDPDRPSGTFWAGEAFVLEAMTTDTGASGTKAASVTVTAFGQQPKALDSTDSAKTRWSALYRSADTDIDFSRLDDGTYTFVFTATYTNGTVKTHAVTITIDESMDAYASVHRLH